MSTTNGSGKWTGNGVTFDTKEEAEGWVTALGRRWLAEDDTRVIEVDPDFLDRIIID